MSKNDIVKQMAAMRGGDQFPVMKIIDTNPGLSAVISKLRDDNRQPRYTQGGNRELAQPNNMAFRAQSDKTMSEIKDAEGVQQILPDIELSAQILISAVLSPKDMVTLELIYGAPEGILPTSTSMEIIQALRKHFEQTYKIKNSLSQILRDCLFDRGAHIRMVLPENSLDEFINRSTPYSMAMEDFSSAYTRHFENEGKPKPLGILGPGLNARKPDESKPLAMETLMQDNAESVDGSIAFESFDGFDKGTPKGAAKTATDDLVFVTDNITVLSMPSVARRIQEIRVNEKLAKRQVGFALENRINDTEGKYGQSIQVARRKLSDRELQSVLFKQGTRSANLLTSLKTQQQLDRRTIGNPLVMELPTEAVIPVHVPGQPENHIGYFVLLDNMGHPISIKNRADHFSSLVNGVNIANTSLPSQVIQRTKSMMGGFDCSNTEHLNYSAQVYQDLIVADLLARLRNGVYTNGVELGGKDDVYRIMFARTLQQQRTQLLFVPIELVTYFAFRYNADGIGRSILSDTKIINALRSTLMFANTMAAIRNSIGMTTVNFKLDPEDPDPQKSVDIMMGEVLRSRQQAFPLNTASPADIVYQLQRSGYQFSYTGHPGLPDIAVEFGERASNYPKPDTELEENLRKRSIMAYGLNPESVDTAFSGEFATTVTQNNILLTRRVMQLQDQFTPQLTSHLVKYVRASEQLMEEIYAAVNDAYDKLSIPQEIREKFSYETDQELRARVQKDVIVEHLVNMFLEGLEITLPRPTTVTLENQAASFEAYVKLLDQALDAWLSQDYFTQELTGEISATVTAVRASVKAYYVRKWFSDNGVMPELADITAQDSDGNPRVQFWHEQKAHIEALMKSMAGLAAGLQAIQSATDKVAQDAGIEANGMGGGGGFGGGFGGGGGGFDQGGGGFGDDLGLPSSGSGGEPGSDITEETSSTTTNAQTPGENEEQPEGKGPEEPQG